MSNKIEIIPKKVIEMAKAIEDAKKNGHQLVIIQGRRSGRQAAIDLANSEDAEIIQPKQIENNEQ